MSVSCIYARPGYCTYYKQTPICDGDMDCSYYLEDEEREIEEDYDEQTKKEKGGENE